MIKIFAGLKGSGKTKNLIELVNAAQEATSGCVVCIEKGTKLIHEINNKTRLVDISEYAIETALKTNIVKKGDRVIITGASAVGNAVTDTIKLHIL